jgi:hypothetical protein
MSKGTIVALGAAAVAALIVVGVWFQPQTLLFDRVVDEALPITDSVAQSGAPSEAPTTQPRQSAPRERPLLLGSGEFASRNRYTVRGSAGIYRLADGRRILRFEKFASTNGPDLRVYLARATSGAGDSELGQDLLDLGPLKGNRGSQNYEIPPGTVLADYRSAVIWCRRFTVGFGAADLRAP